jgi:hypothetical protein
LAKADEQGKLLVLPIRSPINMKIDKLFRFISVSLGLALAGSTNTVSAQVAVEGYLCCTLRYDKSRGMETASDANWAEWRKMLPAGTKVKVGRAQIMDRSRWVEGGPYDFSITAGKTELVLFNKYSQHLSPPDYISRLVLSEDPSAKIASYSPEIQSAIKSGRVLKGMTKEQVVTSLGYPLKKENPDLKSLMWRYYYGSFDEFFVLFDASEQVVDITGVNFALADVTVPASKK